MARPPYFDAQIHVTPLSDQDLRDLRYFGVGGAVAVAGDEVSREAKELISDLEKQITVGAARLRDAGIAPFFAIGVHPSRIPERGFEEVLAQFPALSERARVVAVGLIGLHHGGEEEEEVFRRQLDMALSLRLPVIVGVPDKNSAAHLRRSLAILREHEFPQEKVLVSGVDAKSVRLVRSCGHHAALLIHPSRVTAEEAVVLIRQLGSQGLLLASDLGGGPGDIVGVPRAVHLLAQAGVSRTVARRVARDNALSFFGIDPAVL